MGKNKKSSAKKGPRSKPTSFPNKRNNKNKAKVVKSQLKNIKVQTKSKVEEVDKSLEQLGAHLRSSSELKQAINKKNIPVPSKLPTRSNEESVKNEEIIACNMKKLDSMQL